MSVTYLDAASAPAPSIPVYKLAHASASRSNTRRLRRLSSPTKNKSPNDAHVSAPPPDLIHDLLASFGSISVPSEDRHLHPALRTEPRRTSSTSGAVRRPSSATSKQQDRSLDYPSYKRPSVRAADFWNFEEAAEPPVIRTARTSVSNTRNGSAAPPALPGSVSEYRPVNEDAYLGNGSAGIAEERKSSRRRPSIQPDDFYEDDSSSYASTIRNLSDGRRSPQANIAVPRLPASTSWKGKEKVIDQQDARPPRRDIFDSPRKQRVYITPSESPPTSRQSTARTSLSLTSDARPTVSAFENYHRRFNSVGSTIKESVKRPRPSEDVSSAQRLGSGVVVPPRGSSLKRVDSLTLLRKRASFQSTIGLDMERSATPRLQVPEPDRPPISTYDDDSGALRRIKELKAAREALTRTSNDTERYEALSKNLPLTLYSSIDEQSTQYSGSMPRSTSFARRQLEQGSYQDLYRPSMDAANTEASFTTSGFSSSRVSADILPVEYINFSRDKPTVVRSPSPSRTLRPQTPSQGLQQNEPRKKRWSQSQTGLRVFGASSPVPIIQDSPPRKKSSLIFQGSPRSKSFVSEAQPKRNDSVTDDVTSYLQATRFSQKVIVPGENRTITFSDVGDPQGHAVFCCVGMGMTRYIMAFYDELATSLKLRLITPDRPGIGGSESYPEGPRQPVNWPDDVGTLCRHLHIRDFSLLAHSAGTIYALATALRMPSNIIGRIHLLAPWIPPSQLSAPAIPGYASTSPSPTNGGNALPRSQRFLRMLPTPFLKLSTASWVGNPGITRTKSPMPTRSRSRIDLFRASTDVSSGGTSPRISFNQLRAAIGGRRPSNTEELQLPSANIDDVVLSSIPDDEILSIFENNSTNTPLSNIADIDPLPTSTVPTIIHTAQEDGLERRKRFDDVLTPAIWELATKNANPAVDLLVCLERHQSIGFRYADVELSTTALRNNDAMNSPSYGLSRTSSAYNSGSSTPRNHTHRSARGQLDSASGSVVVLNGIDNTYRTNVTGSPHINGNGNDSYIPQPSSLTNTSTQNSSRRIVIHHGSKDARVPLENVKWLARTMRGVELRVVEGEGHGLMAAAGVMGGVLSEMAAELEGRGGR